MARAKRTTGPTRVEAHTHRDKRANIPTEELREFVAEDEASPKTVTLPGLLYARDPSLDPQLVWKGKDEQDRTPLEVPAVPVYIQEKVQPRAIIENVRAEAQKGRAKQLDLFSDFNGIAFSELVDFYHHQQHWSNRLILGDSLLVMTSLAEKERLKGQVQMVYLDPPYGIKFGSNWQVSTRKRDVKDGKVEDVTRQPEQIRAFRDTWQLGIHSYLTYLRDRLVVARELLAESGSIFVQIGDENVHLVRSLLDEVFGAENFCSVISFLKTTGAGSFAGGTNVLSSVADYLLWYAKDLPKVRYRALYQPREIGGKGSSGYGFVERPDGTRLRSADDAETGRFTADNLTSQTTRVGQTTVFPVEWAGGSYEPGKGGWKTNREGMARLVRAARVIALGNTLRYVRFHDDFPLFPFHNAWDDTTTAGFADPKTYVVQTNAKVIERCLLMTTDPGDLVLDPTCGSGTTAFVAEQWGRRWITVDTSRVALALARTRLMAARFPYYLLSDSPEGQRKEAEIVNVDAASRRVLSETRRDASSTGDLRKGFVVRRVPHVTLKSIANNEEVDAIHERHQPALDELLARLNKATGAALREWEVPREPARGWPKKAEPLLAEWWDLRRRRQAEVDASIARRADTELLIDQPYEDSKRIRVSGPFTVESLSPHRVLPTDEERPTSEQQAQKEPAAGQFELMILDNLRKAGVQNTRRQERLVFSRLEPHAGVWIQAVGEYADAEGVARRVAVSIGPEHGTVGPDQVKEAAKEAVKGAGFDLLVVLGFAFDAHAGETAKEFEPQRPAGRGDFVADEPKQWGSLQILLARMNPDLAMGDELLKKTGAGNLFMVFGEPDVTVDRTPDGKLTVTLRGVDVYDPTTGQIRSSSTDDIACWFLDTAYNEESFFVRHAYFTGAEEPYDRLKRSLRADIDESAWSALYQTTSLPFDPPSTGKIAIKVINHYGDEVLKVVEVGGAPSSER